MAAEVKIPIVGDASKYKKALGEAEGATDHFMGNLKKLAVAAAGAFAADKLLQFGVDSVKAAAEDEKSQRTLAEQLKRTTGATDDQVASIEKFITKTQNATGVLDDQLRPALGQLVRATGDTDKAQSLLGLTLDIAAATGKDAETVALALGKAYQGNVGGLQRLGISMKDANGESLSFADAQKQLTEQFGGAAAVAADTAEGKYKVMQARFSDLQEEIGAKLLPVLAGLAEFMTNTLIPGVEKVVAWFEENWPKIKDTIVEVFDAVKPYLDSVVQVFKGIFEAIYGVFEVFKGLFTGDWSLMWQGIVDFVTGIKDIIVGAVKGLWAEVQLVGEVIWAAIGSGVTKAWNGIKDAITIPITAVKDILEGIWDTISSAASTAWNGVKSVIEPIIKTIIGIIQGIIDVVHGAIAAWDILTGKTNSTPNTITQPNGDQFIVTGRGGLSRVPQGADGGIVKATSGGQLVNVAEAGHDEALIPLDGKHGLGGGHTFNVTIAPPVGTDPAGVVKAFEKWVERNGQPGFLSGPGGISGGRP